MSATTQPMKDRRGQVYTAAVGPGLRPLLWCLLGGFAFLAANGCSLASVTLLTWMLGTTQQTYFYFLMVLFHLILGIVLIVPFVVFGSVHLVTAWNRPNRVAVRYGLALLGTSVLMLLSGLVLVRLGFLEIREPTVRSIGYWLHVLTPLAAAGFYVRHRLAGPRIRWEWARGVGGVSVVAIDLLWRRSTLRIPARTVPECTA